MQKQVKAVTQWSINHRPYIQGCRTIWTNILGDCALSGGRFAQQVMIASYLAAWLLIQLALTAALVLYAKDTGVSITRSKSR